MRQHRASTWFKVRWWRQWRRSAATVQPLFVPKINLIHADVCFSSPQVLPCRLPACLLAYPYVFVFTLLPVPLVHLLAGNCLRHAHSSLRFISVFIFSDTPFGNGARRWRWRWAAAVVVLETINEFLLLLRCIAYQPWLWPRLVVEAVCLAAKEDRAADG